MMLIASAVLAAAHVTYPGVAQFALRPAMASVPKMEAARETVAEKIRAKVNAMNLSLTVASPLIVLAYAALPTLGGGK